MNAMKRNILEAVGNTPLVRLNRVVGQLRSVIAAKLEYMNPGGSIKDRIGITIIEEAEQRGELSPGATIVEATSGNTGMGLALVAAMKGYKLIFVMPDKMSQEKIQNLRSFGAKVIVTPTKVAPDDPRSYYSVARRLAQETPNAFYANQYHNPDNPLAHYRTTGPEIWEQTGGEIDAFVAGMGTGGTLTGVSRFLKERKPAVLIAGVDPEGSVYKDYFERGVVVEPHPYLIEGIGEDFFPSTMDLKALDKVVRVHDKESCLMARELLTSEGLYTGSSGGAAVVGAIRFAREHEAAGGRPLNIVTILPDSGSRYLSKLYNDDWMREAGFLESRVALGSVKDVLVRRYERGEVITCGQFDTVRDVITKMKAHGISQLPVMEGDKLLGLIEESDLVVPLMQGRVKASDTIERLVVTRLHTVDPDAPADALVPLFDRGEVAIVGRDDQFYGLITKIDFIAYLGERLK
jgi:cystathionine beta-synthase